ncbi:hypothetical protein ASPZODRAFT_133721 [Penicilliopsis zonata CBS 506.65]|uniref:Kelch repeat protein n=1 Tax=Penicilliopsis zonata CBS 506.65 TaxID=1073090 RepID=A0A1L9SF98_9EURO|nr:hypothetical protein ASPZODRAFT_133721 [Penicilliopsis zonata CBS 506.65]OJJ45849.1 hypothetical protein ASPZODRAFT_133721 [Penicilliopsis zonata CBS 506.65]
MWFLLETVLTVLAVVVDRTAACSDWETQINISMCNWQELRANVIRDIIYLDGGELWFQQGFSDGCVNYNNDGNADGYIYYLNLSTSFNTSSNFMTVLSNSTVAGGAATDIAPNYIDGYMFANDDEFYLYGGMLRLTNSTQSPSGDEVIGYEAYQYGPYRESFTPGWYEETLSTGVTRYITNGAGASAPSENLGFYFSGMRAPDWGPFTFDGMESNTTANTLITVDMSVMRDEKWYNTSLPDYIPGRANAGLVWVPVAESGVLVAIGGVVDPVEMWQDTGLSTNQTELSESVSPTFMETVSVYDVNTKTWYLQNTTGDTPPQLTQFCVVLASAPDGSSHNIYLYGGYNGIDYEADPSDDVYILSLPSFQWIKAYNGTSTHGRSGHQCIKVYPDQMLAVGGVHVGPTNCLEGGIIVNFNLNTLLFQDDYNPTQWSDYQVPDLVIAQIGGNSSGGATTTAPSSWTNTSLAKIFDTSYNKTITTYWPYGTSDTTTTSTSDHKSDGLPHWAAAVIGVVCGLVVVALLVWFWFYRRRRHQRRVAEAEAVKETGTTEQPKWMYGSGPMAPGPGPKSTSTAVETVANESTADDSVATAATPGTVESGGGVLYEMHDSSPAELPGDYGMPFRTPILSPQPSPMLDSPFPGDQPSPVSPQTPAESDSGQSSRPGHRRSPSSLSTVPSLSIDNVVTSRTTYFHEAFDTGNMQRTRHGSEISEASVSSEGRERFGNETIHELNE